MIRRPQALGPVRPWLQALAVGVAYFATAWTGLELHTQVSTSITLIWPPTGVALAGARLYGPRTLVGVYLAAFTVNAIAGAADPGSAAIIGLGNTGAVGIAWLLLDGLPPFVEGRGHMVRLAGAAAIGCLVSASIGVSALASAGFLTPEHVAVAWATWWAGDFFGMLLFEPPILTFMRRP